MSKQILTRAAPGERSGSKTFIMRLPAVIAKTGVARSTIYNWVQNERFPRPINLGSRAVGWLSEDIEAWLEHRLRESRNGN